ncbi:hypothetical protein F8388_004143 [Cannabis sativa]|uniref:Uncharacterized protein n=1 Tax=Cannabis sativa TaxID=3483 RepID=A0A7J6E6Z8_CANSA|nr:hypothetical protein F8388_004143 [Cannabis sativa]
MVEYRGVHGEKLRKLFLDT